MHMIIHYQASSNPSNLLIKKIGRVGRTFLPTKTVWFFLFFSWETSSIDARDIRLLDNWKRESFLERLIWSKLWIEFECLFLPTTTTNERFCSICNRLDPKAMHMSEQRSTHLKQLHSQLKERPIISDRSFLHFLSLSVSKKTCSSWTSSGPSLIFLSIVERVSSRSSTTIEQLIRDRKKRIEETLRWSIVTLFWSIDWLTRDICSFSDENILSMKWIDW